VPVVIQPQSPKVFVRKDDAWKIRFEGTSFAPSAAP
jgi:hypothetical protein